MTKIRYEEAISDLEVKNYLYPSFWKEIKDYLYYFVKVFVVVSVVSIFVRTSVVDLVLIKGKSMYPNYNLNENDEDKVYVNKLAGKFSTYKRGQVVVIVPPKGCTSEKTFYVKRIIGLPNETIKISGGNIYIINEQYPEAGIRLDESKYLQPLVKSYKNISQPDSQDFVEKKLAKNEYYFMGDNRLVSQDSRICGPISEEKILGGEVYLISARGNSYSRYFQLPTYNIGNQ
jgi:signal peptidase I